MNGTFDLKAAKWNEHLKFIYNRIHAQNCATATFDAAEQREKTEMQTLKQYIMVLHATLINAI